MHHTDYSNNLRQSQHKTIKNRLLKTPRHTGDLRSAVLAVLLILLALFQMDPANAQTAPDTAGFGTLQFDSSEKPIKATVIDSSIKMIVYNNALTLIVDQTFSNPTTANRSGEYVFAVPMDAVVQAGHFTLIDYAHCRTAQGDHCTNTTQTNLWQNLKSERSNSVLRITTPPIGAMQTLHVYLNIEFPAKLGNHADSPVLPFSDDFAADNLPTSMPLTL